MSAFTRCHAFSGTPAEAARRLFALPPHALGGGYCALLLESDGRADVQVLLRPDPAAATGEVRHWSGATLGDLPERVVRAAWTVPAPSSDVRAVIAAHGEFAVHPDVPCPPTPRALFARSVREHLAADRVRVFVVTRQRGA